jgi:transposase
VSDTKPRNPRLIRYPAEMRDRGVEMFFAVVAETGERHGAVQRVATALGVSDGAVRKWVREADLAAGRRAPLAGANAPGTPVASISSAAEQRIRELERENRELRRANEILKSASAFFAAELDRLSPRS